MVFGVVVLFHGGGEAAAMEDGNITFDINPKTNSKQTIFFFIIVFLPCEILTAIICLVFNNNSLRPAQSEAFTYRFPVSKRKHSFGIIECIGRINGKCIFESAPCDHVVSAKAVLFHTNFHYSTHRRLSIPIYLFSAFPEKVPQTPKIDLFLMLNWHDCLRRAETLEE
jgi:hypothetical protein